MIHQLKITGPKQSSTKICEIKTFFQKSKVFTKKFYLFYQLVLYLYSNGKKK